MRIFLIIFSAVSLFSVACIKEDAPAIGSRGSSYITFLQAPENDVYLTPFTTVDTVSLVSLRRDETSQAAMSQPVTVKLINDTAAITTYNDSNGTSFELLPDSLYSFVGRTGTKTNNDYTVTIPGGTIGNELNIAMNGAKWDVSHKYAFYFIIVDSAGHKIKPDQNEVLVTIQAKNAYDADYQVTGWFFHPTAGRAINVVKHLSTLSIPSVSSTVGDLATPFEFTVSNTNVIDWYSGGFTSSGFMTQDNPGGTDYSNATNAGHVPGDATFNSTIYNNTYNPSTKTFYLHYGYVNGVEANQSGYTRQIYEKWVRIN